MKVIQELCVAKGLTLSLAESCTGGHLSACITAIPGCSQYFLGSIIAYSNQAKIDLLNVQEMTLKSCGAVSKQVVEEMAQGVLKRTGSDYSIAVSGIAGPTGGSLEKPVGTIWGCIASNEGYLNAWEFFLKGDRQEIIDQCVATLLMRFQKVLEE